MKCPSKYQAMERRRAASIPTACRRAAGRNRPRRKPPGSRRESCGGVDRGRDSSSRPAARGYALNAHLINPGQWLTWIAFIAALVSGFGWLAASLGRGEGARGRRPHGVPDPVGRDAARHRVPLVDPLQPPVHVPVRATTRPKTMPSHFVFAAFWGGQEARSCYGRSSPHALGLVLMKWKHELKAPAMFFLNLPLVMLTLVSVMRRPFLRSTEVFTDGVGLNPLLQDYWMTIHPPVLFLGFSSFVVPFAIAGAALWKRDYDGWVKPVMPWVVFSHGGAGDRLHHGRRVGVQGARLGRLLGLGPGRERLAHSVARHGGAPCTACSCSCDLLAAEDELLPRDHRLRARALRVVPHALRRAGGLLGALVREPRPVGLPALVHRDRGSRRLRPAALPPERHPNPPEPLGSFSRESFMWLGQLVFMLMCLLVTLGMSAPLVTRLFGPPANVQTSYYNLVNAPLAIAMGLLLGISPLLRWRHATKCQTGELARREEPARRVRRARPRPARVVPAQGSNPAAGPVDRVVRHRPHGLARHRDGAVRARHARLGDRRRSDRGGRDVPRRARRAARGGHLRPWASRSSPTTAPPSAASARGWKHGVAYMGHMGVSVMLIGVIASSGLRPVKQVTCSCRR